MQALLKPDEFGGVKEILRRLNDNGTDSGKCFAETQEVKQSQKPAIGRHDLDAIGPHRRAGGVGAQALQTGNARERRPCAAGKNQGEARSILGPSVLGASSGKIQKQNTCTRQM